VSGPSARLDEGPPATQSEAARSRAADWHSFRGDEVTQLLDVDSRTGLASAEVARRRETFGPNLPSTARSVARALGLSGSAGRDLVVSTGRELQQLGPAELRELAERAAVFARVASIEAAVEEGRGVFGCPCSSSG
jgi:magnesium-transporting ATPase (P-type)